MATPTADSLLDLERTIEADIITCLNLLEQGKEQALKELGKSLQVAGSSGAAALERLHSTAAASVAHVEAVQRELGALNLALTDFVLTDSLTIENLPAFDLWRDRVLKAIHDAKDAIELLGTEGDPEGNAELENVWRQSQQRLEIVRVHLEMDESRAAGEFALQRKALHDRVAQLREELERDPQKVRERLHYLSSGEDKSADARRLGGWIKALWMWRESGQQ